MLDDNLVWKIVTGVIGTLLGVIWYDAKSDIKSNSERIQALDDKTYTKDEVDRMIQLHIEPLQSTQDKMWEDIKEIKRMLLRKYSDG